MLRLGPLVAAVGAFFVVPLAVEDGVQDVVAVDITEELSYGTLHAVSGGGERKRKRDSGGRIRTRLWNRRVVCSVAVSAVVVVDDPTSQCTQ